MESEVKKQSWLGEVHYGGEDLHWTVVPSKKMKKKKKKEKEEEEEVEEDKKKKKNEKEEEEEEEEEDKKKKKRKKKKGAQTTEICRWMIIYVEIYFTSLHLLTQCTSVRIHICISHWRYVHYCYHRPYIINVSTKIRWQNKQLQLEMWALPSGCCDGDGPFGEKTVIRLRDLWEQED